MSEATINTPEFDNQTLFIDRATVEDVEQIEKVRREGWLSAYPNEELGISYEDIRQELEGVNGELIAQTVNRWRKGIEADVNSSVRANYVARLNGKVVGFVAPRIDENGQRRVGALYVSPDAQGKGIGTKLLQRSVNWHGRENDVYLHVVSYNQKSIDFYEHFGFVKTGHQIIDTYPIERMEIPEIEMVLKANHINKDKDD